MSRLVARCPSCESHLLVTRLSCPSCAVQLNGEFALPPLLDLEPAELRFLVEFVRCSGSLKEMARREGQSYPTIRGRLDELIAKLDRVEDRQEIRRHEILDALARGELSAAEAAERLKEVGE